MFYLSIGGLMDRDTGFTEYEILKIYSSNTLWRVLAAIGGNCLEKRQAKRVQFSELPDFNIYELRVYPLSRKDLFEGCSNTDNECQPKQIERSLPHASLFTNIAYMHPGSREILSFRAKFSTSTQRAIILPTRQTEISFLIHRQLYS